MLRRYRACSCVEGGSCAADDPIGLEGSCSRTLQKHCCRLASDASFRSSGEHLSEMIGVRMCAETVRKIVESHGRSMALFQPDDAAFAEAEGEVEFAVDGGKSTRSGKAGRT